MGIVMKISVLSFDSIMIAAVATTSFGAFAGAAVAQTVAPAASKPAATTSSATPSAALEAPKADANAGYVLGPDDVIEVSVLGQPEFTTRSRIRADGSIVLPYVGSTTVSGDTPVSLAKRIGGVLKAGGYYSNPIVSIEIAGFASRYVIVLGALAQPGLQPVDRPYRVSEIVARAGGIRGDGADFVIVRREKGGELDRKSVV